MEPFSVSYGLAFLAGLASFLSPCVLSLVPAYVGYLGGRAAGGEAAGSNRWITILHGLAFILGFSTVFIIFNIIASALGFFLFEFRDWLAKIGGVIIIIFGLHMIGIFRIPFLDYDLRIHHRSRSKLGYLSSFLMGIFFSAGWSPCIGPILGMILTFAINSGDVVRGTLLGLAYSTGFSIPFLFSAFSVGWVIIFLRRHSRMMYIIEIVTGILMVILGILLIFGLFNLLATFAPFVDFGI